LRIFFFEQRRPGAEEGGVPTHSDDGAEEEGSEEGVGFEFWEGERREEEKEGVWLETVDGAGDVGPGDAGGFRGGAEAERGEPVFVRLFDFVVAFAAVVARAVRMGVGVGVSAVGVDVRVTVATADLFPES